MPTHHKISIPRTAHYYTLGEAGGNTRRFWIACHGYGQLASTFIRRFDGLDDGETFVLAPEGLSYFYWGGYTGDPVASWMTRQHRLDEIHDYANYLQTLYDLFRRKMPEDVQVNLLGFSQGVATQVRWIMEKFPEFDNLLLWAGLMPEDLDYRPHRDFFAKRKVKFVYGTKDPFLTVERLNWQRQFAAEQLPVFDEEKFEGVHEVPRDVLVRVAASL